MPHANVTYLVKQLEMALRPGLNAACSAVGLTPAQYTALTVLQALPGLTASEVSRRSFVRVQTTAATLEPLLAAGLVRRETDPTHARRILLYLTDDGAELLARSTAGMDALEDLIASGMSSTEYAEFVELLRRVRHTIESGSDRPSGWAEGTVD